MMLKRLEQWDHLSFCRLFNRSTSRYCAKGSYWLSKTADGPLYVLLVLSLLALDITDVKAFSLIMLTAFAIELPLYLILKNSIRRARPAEALIAYVQAHITPSDQFSLPSGHTAGAFVVLTCIACYYPLMLPLVLCWALGIGMSRILLGVHFPLDVIAGALLGTGSALTACFLLG